MPVRIISLLACFAISVALTANGARAETPAWNPNNVRTLLDNVGASVIGGGVDAVWSADGEIFWFKDEADGIYYQVDVASGVKTPVLTPESLAAAFSGTDAGGKPEFISFDGKTGRARFRLGDMSYDLDLTDLAAHKVDDETMRLEDLKKPKTARTMFPINGWDRRELPSPDGSQLATLIDDDFGLRAADSEESVRLTNNGAADFQWFFAGDLWESSGSPWSPDGRYVVARTHDMRNVQGFPIVDWLETNETVTQFRYWARAGQPLPITTFYIFNAETGGKTKVDIGSDPDSLAFFIDWAPDSSEFVFIRYSRNVQKQELFAVNAKTGEARLLFSDERRSGWVKWPGGSKTIEFLPSGDGFLWRADRDGWFHIYRYDRDGKVIGQLTSGDFAVQSIVAVDETGGWVYFMAGSDASRPYDTHLNRVSLDGGGIQQLTDAPGRHRIAMSPDNAFFLDTHSHFDRAPRTDLRTANGRFITTLAEARVVESLRKGWTTPEEFVVKAADGETDVHGVIFKPHNFNPRRRYPVIERVYGAMQSNVTPRGYVGSGRSYPGAEYQTMLAYFNALGFVVVTMDTPGTPGRGRDFNLVPYGVWPDGVMADHAAALKNVGASRRYMDMDRVGVDGNSWGGYMATRA
ncbi:MAG: DPP IV N-terminal domain-containing protein, partial [Pseudomonadota bacterium]